MGWIMGDWRVYKEGEIHQVVKRCIKLLQDREYHIRADYWGKKEEINCKESDGGLFENLMKYEKEKGVAVLLETLISGQLWLRGAKGEIHINLQVRLRAPEDKRENVELFKDMITTWVNQDTLSFTERFFRLPKIIEDVADRYFDNPLERILRKTFGFHFKYKLIVNSPSGSSGSAKLREDLNKILSYS